MNKKKKTILIIASCILVLLFVFLFIIIKNSGEAKVCNSFSVTECPNSCVVCPPCEVCSSISCQSEEFCESIGFNRSWYDAIKIELQK